MEILLNILLIIMALYIVIENNNLKLVLCMGGFSLIIATLYYMYKAPDVALAEAAIGSAIIPLIYIVAISRQNEFIVINQTGDEFLQGVSGEGKGEGRKILENFCSYYGFNLVLLDQTDVELSGIFRKNNVDLIIQKSPETGKYIFKGKKSNILMHRLEKTIEGEQNIKIVKVEEKEKND